MRHSRSVGFGHKNTFLNTTDAVSISFMNAAPLSACRCLLKRPDTGHDARPLISVTALSTQQEVPQGAVNRWDVTSRLYQFVIPSLHCDPQSNRKDQTIYNNEAFHNKRAGVALSLLCLLRFFNGQHTEFI